MCFSKLGFGWCLCVCKVGVWLVYMCLCRLVSGLVGANVLMGFGWCYVCTVGWCLLWLVLMCFCKLVFGWCLCVC